MSVAAVAAPRRRWTALRHPALLALPTGAVAALALPPVHAWPALLAFAVLLGLVRGTRSARGGFLVGWSFGFGWFLAGLYWIAIAFYTDAERFGALAVPAVVALSATLALAPGVAGAAVAWRPWRSVPAQALALAVAWTFGDIARTGWGIGFLWNPVAVVWAASDAMLQPLAWIGAYPLGALTVLVGALPVTVWTERGRARWTGPVLAGLVLALWWGAGWARLDRVATVPPEPPVRVRVVQANVAQHHKWDPERRADWFRRHLELSVTSAAAPPDVIVWPESAVPYQIEREPLVRDYMARVAPPGGWLLAGGDRYELERDPPIASNSLFAIDDRGTVAARYDKVDLVPFGEYLPLRPVLAGVGLEKLTAGSLDFVAGPGRQTIALPGLPPFSPLICYEAIFPGRATREGARPAWLLNVTNDAWFGDSSGPHQHLAQARMRAVEEGLPLVRAANTGISVVTDAYGRVLQRLDLGAAGVLDRDLPPALAEAPLSRRWGTVMVPLLLLALLACSVLVEKRARRSSPTI